MESIALLNKKPFAKVCFHGFAIEWIKSYDVSFVSF